MPWCSIDAACISQACAAGFAIRSISAGRRIICSHISGVVSHLNVRPMSESLKILQNPSVLQRTSVATRAALEELAAPISADRRFLPAPLYELLEQITAALLPQGAIGTTADIAGAIDKRLGEGKNAGWRFADLPADGEAYQRGLTIFSAMLQQTPLKSFGQMPAEAREGYLRCVANGDVDDHARFPLAKWLLMLRTDAVKVWLAHPSTMHAIAYYGFADGATGNTNGPTEHEGWSAITPNTSLPFEQSASLPEGKQQ